MESNDREGQANRLEREPDAADQEDRRLAALARENPNAMAECDGSGAVIRHNAAVARILEELGLRDVREILPRSHEQYVTTAMETLQRQTDVEVSVRGRVLAWTYQAYPPGDSVHLFAIDITSRSEVEEQLRHDALHDALTGLPNRLLFMERLTHAIHRARRKANHLFAVLFLDLDRFKVINDSLGHHVGDELLMVVAKRLESCLRPMDTVARVGGDEFAILAIEADSHHLDNIRTRLQQALDVANRRNLHPFELSVSIGVVSFDPDQHTTVEELMDLADREMYAHKRGHAQQFN